MATPAEIKKNNQKNSPLNNHITCNERAVEPLEQQKIQQFTFLHVPLFPNYFEYLKKGPQKNHADMFTVLFTGRLLGFTKKKKSVGNNKRPGVEMESDEQYQLIYASGSIGGEEERSAEKPQVNLSF